MTLNRNQGKKYIFYELKTDMTKYKSNTSYARLIDSNKLNIKVEMSITIFNDNKKSITTPINRVTMYGTNKETNEFEPIDMKLYGDLKKHLLMVINFNILEKYKMGGMAISKNNRLFNDEINFYEFMGYEYDLETKSGCFLHIEDDPQVYFFQYYDKDLRLIADDWIQNDSNTLGNVLKEIGELLTERHINKGLEDFDNFDNFMICNDTIENMLEIKNEHKNKI